MIIKYENKNGQIYINGKMISSGLIETAQWAQGIPAWQAAISLAFPEVVVNDEVEAMVGNMDNKPRMDFHINEICTEIDSVRVYI